MAVPIRRVRRGDIWAGKTGGDRTAHPRDVNVHGNALRSVRIESPPPHPGRQTGDLDVVDVPDRGASKVPRGGGHDAATAQRGVLASPGVDARETDLLGVQRDGQCGAVPVRGPMNRVVGREVSTLTVGEQLGAHAVDERVHRDGRRRIGVQGPARHGHRARNRLDRVDRADGRAGVERNVAASHRRVLTAAGVQGRQTDLPASPLRHGDAGIEPVPTAAGGVRAQEIRPVDVGCHGRRDPADVHTHPDGVNRVGIDGPPSHGHAARVRLDRVDGSERTPARPRRPEPVRVQTPEVAVAVGRARVAGAVEVA